MRVLLVLVTTVALLLSGCVRPAAQPSATPSPLPQETRPATDTTPVPAEGQPTPDPGNATPPAPPLPPSSHLAPYTPQGWPGPLVVSGQPEVGEPVPLHLDRPVLVSWALTNRGSADVTTPFFVDLYFDDLLVERWQAREIKAGAIKGVQGWDALGDRVRLTPGEHTLRLVIDPTRLVGNSDQFTESISVQAVWLPGDATPSPGVDARVFSRVVPFTPPDWDGPIQAYSVLNGRMSRQLSLDTPTILRIAYRNEGFTTTPRDFFVYLSVDDQVVAIFRQQPPLIPDEEVLTKPWAGMVDALRLAPGPHQLTVKVDATDLLDGAEAQDRTYTTVLVWHSTQQAEEKGPFPEDSLATIPMPRFEAPPGWDAPALVSPAVGALEQAPIGPGTSRFLNWGVRNRGGGDMAGALRVMAYIDSTLVGSWDLSGLGAGKMEAVLDWSMATMPPAMAPGSHALTLLLGTPDADGNLAQTLDRFSRSFLWDTPAPPPRTPTAYTLPQLRERLARLDAFFYTRRLPVGEDRRYQADDLLAVADAVYFSLYGKSLQDEDLAIHILSDRDYATWIDLQCRDVLRLLAPDLRPRYQEGCYRLVGQSGFAASWRGRWHIVINGDLPPAEVLAVLAHELGHFRQALANPALGQADSLDLRALREALAFLHEAVFLRTLEELTGRSLTAYPRIEGYQRYIQEVLAGYRAGAERSDHDRGRLLLWLALLSDSNLRSFRTTLFIQGHLPPTSGRQVFAYLLGIRPQEVDAYVANLFRSLDAQFPGVESLALSRLVLGLGASGEGHPAFREVGLLLP
ncbi:MAG: hypothetical protein HY683_01770 [Chloroflexi bacterium]|nr:hypothetical protein [Chloroflexota bacterium]